MKKHSVFQENNRKSVVYLSNDEYTVAFFEDNECIIEKNYCREWEAEQAAEDFVLGFSV